ncbi:MAG: zinc carboxypeptidase [bacterium]|nr:zinc carboxypeptidase [bacterium]
MLLSATLAAAIFVPVPQDVSAPAPDDARHLVRVDLSERRLSDLKALDLDVVFFDQVEDSADVIVGTEELAQLERTGYTFDVVEDDLAAWYAARLAPGTTSQAAGSHGGWLSPPFGQGAMGGYYTYTQIVSVLDQMRAAYPNRISAKQSIGQTIEGREMWMVRISDNPDTDEDEPEVRIDAIHHAREPQGMQSTFWFMLFLLEEYGTDPLATYLVNEREIYFVPCVNPDGYEYNR